MKYLNSLYFLMLCIAITLSSCNDGIEPNDNAIQFGYDTRSLEPDYATVHGTAATIWGYSTNGGWVYGSENGLTATLNTTDNTFTVEGVDTENYPEYWSNDSYHFYSLWPPITNSADGTSGGIRFVDDANRKGLYFYFDTKDQKDQLASYFTVSGNNAASRTEPVHFEYKHICSKLIFNIRKNTANSNEHVALLSFKLHNVNTFGTCSYRQSSTPVWATADADKTIITLYEKKNANGESVKKDDKLATYDEITAEVNGTNVVDGGYLIIPQTVPYNAVAISFTYGFVHEVDAENGDKEYEVYNVKEVNNVYLPIQTINKWEQNKKYTYNIYLAAESNDIVFGTPTVSTWRERQGGSTIIIQ